MKSKPPKSLFQVTIETVDDTGEVLAVYFQIRKGRQAYVKVFADGAAIADFDKDGYLLGVELTAPCQVRVIDEVTRQEPVSVRNSVRRFVRNSGPPQLVLAG